MSFIQFKDISKSFNGFLACQEINLDIQQSTIHAIVGENGAGKSTLMKILGGIEKPTTGSMRLNQSSYSPNSALDAYRNRIAFIHQHFVLARQLTAFENILLNCSSGLNVLGRIHKKEIRFKTEAILAKFKWSIQLDERVERISVGEQQRLEILKALLLDPDIFIFDEPTAVLTPQESIELLDFILQLKKEKKTIILISHKLNEIKKVADEITVMRGGRVVLTQKNATLSIDQIAESMIGRKSQKSVNLNQNSDGKSTLFRLPGHEIEIFKSEIFGVAGIEGNGQSQLIEDLLNRLQELQISHGDITEDRIPLSVFQNMNLIDHVILKHVKKLNQNGFILQDLAKNQTEKLIQDWDVRPGFADQSLSELSGGNQQKFIVGREMMHSPEVLVAAHPTRGVDLGAQETIHRALIDFSRENRTVFLISSDLDEVLQLSDRYVILYRQKIYGPFLKNSLTESQIGQYMTGQLK